MPELEIISAIPNKVTEPSYTYMEIGFISVEIRNPLPFDVIIERLSGRFAESKPLTSFDSDIFPVRIKAGHSGIVTIGFRVPLSCSTLTNSCRIGIQYRELGSPANKSVTLWPDSTEAQPFIIVNNIPLRREFLFVCHKINEDTPLATTLKSTLMKVGLGTYLAEEDERPGLADYWGQKIFPKIESSTALVVIWTTSVENDRDNVMREVHHSMVVGKPRYVLAAKGTQPDDVFPRNEVEHLRFDQSEPLPRMIVLVERIYHDLESGVLPRNVGAGTNRAAG